MYIQLYQPIPLDRLVVLQGLVTEGNLYLCGFPSYAQYEFPSLVTGFTIKLVQKKGILSTLTIICKQMVLYIFFYWSHDYLT